MKQKILQELRDDPLKFSQIISYALAPLSLFTQQKELLHLWNSNKKTISVIPRGGGKSFTLSMYALFKFYTVPGIKIAFFSLSQRQANKLLDATSDMINQSDALKPSREFFLVDQVQRLKSHTYSEIVALPYDPNTVLGEHPDILLLDECAFYDSDDIYQKVLKPMLTGVRTTFRIPEIHMTSVPDPDEANTFFPTMFKDHEKFGLEKLHKTWMESGGYNKEEVMKDKIDIGERYYLSQLMCEFLPPGTSPFPFELIQKNVSDSVIYNPGAPCFAGVDQGKKRDQSAVCIVQPLKEKIQILNLFLCQYDYSLLARKCQEFYSNFSVSSFLVDTTTGEQFVDFASKPPYSLPLRPFSFAGSMRNSLIDFLHIQMEQGRLMIPDDMQDLLRDLRNFREFHHLPDSVAALALAVWNAKRFSRPSSRKIAVF